LCRIAGSRTALSIPLSPCGTGTTGFPLLAAHGGSGAATRRSQALRVAARAFEVILFDGAGRQEKENCIPPLSRPRPQAVIAPVPGPLAALQPRTEGKT